MSADLELDADGVNNFEEIPATGIRSRSQHARRIHRQHQGADDPLPACGEMHRDADFKECQPGTLLKFQRWLLCDNPECFGTDGIERGHRIETDGGREPYIRFADNHVRRILTGKKTLTVRLEFDRDLSVDDRVDLIDEDGERFATATIATVGEMTALKFVELDPDGHRSYSSIAEFAAHLREYYPDADFWPGSRVHVFRFCDVQPDPHYAPHDPAPEPELEGVNTGL